MRRPGAGRPRPAHSWRGRLTRRRTAPKAGGPTVGVRPALTGRALILAVTLASIAVALAVPVKVYLGQRSAVAALAGRIRVQEARIAALRAQQQAWSSPSYVMAQARSRLHYVLPGETDYIVLGAPPAGAGPAAGVAPAADSAQLGAGPSSEPVWYTQLWDSVRASAQTPAG